MVGQPNQNRTWRTPDRRAQHAFANHGSKHGALYAGIVSGLGRLQWVLRPEMKRW